MRLGAMAGTCNLRWFLLLCLWSAGDAAADKKPASTGDTAVEYWVRKPGAYVDGRESGKSQLKIIEPLKMPAKEGDLFDIQYKAKKRYRFVPLADLVAAHPALQQHDLILLHFDNGMIVAWPRSESMRHLHLAVAYCARPKSCSTDFPKVYKSGEPDQRDPRPLAFGKSKLVATSGWHPDVASSKNSDSFTPWVYVDSLAAIELADAAAYYRQFAVGSTDQQKAGLEVFKQRCQYCHGARQVGAQYGWDFVDPLPIYKQKKPNQLLSHVKYPKWDALRRGLMMPSQKDVTSVEVEQLWQWLKAIAEAPPKPYKP